jgi:hypothetical protein
LIRGQIRAYFWFSTKQNVLANATLWPKRQNPRQLHQAACAALSASDATNALATLGNGRFGRDGLEICVIVQPPCFNRVRRFDNAAARGTTITTTRARRIATEINRTTETTISVFV